MYPACIVIGKVDTHTGGSNERETCISPESNRPEVVNWTDDLPDRLDGDSTVDVVPKLLDAIALLRRLQRLHFLFAENGG